MVDTGNGDTEVKTTAEQDMAVNSTPYPKSARKNTVKTKRSGRRSNKLLPPTKEEALGLLASALIYCTESGIHIGAENTDTGALLAFVGVLCSNNNGNLTFSIGNPV